MKQSISAPAQRTFVHRLVNWKLIDYRCRKYPAIGRAFPLALLQKYQEKEPYYCHYMGWRLGTWSENSVFERLDELLRCAEKLPDWKGERNLLTSADFAEFWSLLWQLQVAEYLCRVGENVRWAKSGPDLSAIVDGQRWYVECYTPRKSFGLLNFLDELLTRLDSSIEISYSYCLPFRLPQNNERSRFLHEVLSPFLNHDYLRSFKRSALQKYPVIIYQHPSSSLHVYLNGPNADAYTPCVIPNEVGNPNHYLEQIISEAVRSKSTCNELREHRPNILAVNFLLSIDFQIASFSKRTPNVPSAPQIAPNLDVLAIAIIGIGEHLTKDNFRVIKASGIDQNALSQIAEIVRR
jgi:hypothetical protein